MYRGRVGGLQPLEKNLDFHICFNTRSVAMYKEYLASLRYVVGKGRSVSIVISDSLGYFFSGTPPELNGWQFLNAEL